MCASIKAFTELDEGYDTIVTKTGATGKALEGLTKSADNVFGTMPEDMSTVGEATEKSTQDSTQQERDLKRPQSSSYSLHQSTEQTSHSQLTKLTKS